MSILQITSYFILDKYLSHLMLKNEIIKIVSAIEFVNLSILVVNEVTQDNPRISKHIETISKQFIATKNHIRSVLLWSLADIVGISQRTRIRHKNRIGK